MQSNQSEQFGWINVKEACEILGISRQTLHQLVQTEFLPAYRVKGVRGLKFKREDVVKLIERVKPDELDGEDEE